MTRLIKMTSEQRGMPTGRQPQGRFPLRTGGRACDGRSEPRRCDSQYLYPVVGIHGTVPPRGSQSRRDRSDPHLGARAGPLRHPGQRTYLGFIATDILQDMPGKVIEQMEERTPLGRLGQPSDIADACVWSARIARFVTAPCYRSMQAWFSDVSTAELTGDLVAVNGVRPGGSRRRGCASLLIPGLARATGCGSGAPTRWRREYSLDHAELRGSALGQADETLQQVEQFARDMLARPGRLRHPAGLRAGCGRSATCWACACLARRPNVQRLVP